MYGISFFSQIPRLSEGYIEIGLCADPASFPQDQAFLSVPVSCFYALHSHDNEASDITVHIISESPEPSKVFSNLVLPCVNTLNNNYSHTLLWISIEERSKCIIQWRSPLKTTLGREWSWRQNLRSDDLSKRPIPNLFNSILDNVFFPEVEYANLYYYNTQGFRIRA